MINEQQILQKLQAIIQWQNDVGSNSKTTEELSDLSPFNRTALIRYSVNGASFKTTVQELIDDIAGEFVLGNVPAKFRSVVIDFSAVGSVHSKVLAAINAMPNYVLQQGTIFFFYTNRIVLTNGVGISETTPGSPQYAVVSEYFVLQQQIQPTSGVTSIGVGGTSVLSGGIRHFNTIDTRSFAPTEFDLGDIVAADIWGSVDTTGPYSTPNGATILFRAVQNGDDKIWLYMGQQEQVGLGEDTTDTNDYRLFPDEDNTDPPPTYQETIPQNQSLDSPAAIKLDNHEIRSYFIDSPNDSLIYLTSDHILLGKARLKINAPSEPGISYQAIVHAGSFVVGITYTIQTVGTTDFTSIGASANIVGIVFTSTGVGTGTGEVSINSVQIGGDGFEPGADMYLEIWYNGYRVEHRFVKFSQGSSESVASVFGRTDAVTAEVGDYLASEVTGAFDKAADDSDNITEGVVNKFTTTDRNDKVDLISITQDVDLDAIETRVNELDAAVILQGVWDASSGSFPGNGTAQAGHSYIVSVAGIVNLIPFAINDRIVAIIDNASIDTYSLNWHQMDYTDQVLSVAGRTGAITLNTADLLDFLSGVLTSTLSGLDLTNSSAVQAADQIIVAFGKIQAQIALNNLKVGVADDTVGVDELKDELKKADVDYGNVSGIQNIDWSDGIQIKVNMTSDTTFLFSNVVQGKTITVLVTGDFVAQWPLGVDTADLVKFKGTQDNYIQFYCADSTAPIYLAGLKVR